MDSVLVHVAESYWLDNAAHHLHRKSSAGWSMRQAVLAIVSAVDDGEKRLSGTLAA